MSWQLHRMRAAVQRGTRSTLSPQGLRGVAVEAAWLVAQVAAYPGGLSRERGRDDQRQSQVYRTAALTPVQRGLLTGDPRAAGTPILLLHGMIGNRSSFVVLRRLLRRRGFHCLVAVNYQVLTHDVRSAAGLLAGKVTALCEATGCERIHIVAHSLGGVIARYYVQRLAGDARVHTLVTLGSPHQGTTAAGLVPHPVCRQLRPGSDLLNELDQPAPACRTRFVAFWSDLDLLMLPKQAAQVSHPDLAADNVAVRGVGHLAMLVDGAIAHRIATTLAQLEPAAPTRAPQRFHQPPAHQSPPPGDHSNNQAGPVEHPDHGQHPSSPSSTADTLAHNLAGSIGTPPSLPPPGGPLDQATPRLVNDLL